VGSDVWASGAAYEPYVGRWSRLVAAELLRWLGAPGGSRWVDVGCGTGAVSDAILRLREPTAVVGIDPSQAYVAHARAHITDPRARFDVGSATALPLDDGVVDVAVSGLVLNFVPDPDRAVSEMARVTRTGGTIGAYVWDYWTPFLGGQAPAPGYAMSLTEDRRAQLRELIRTRLPYDTDGSIPLLARAWAVRGAR
jgi:SAM-dependent methyltransferase